MVDDDVVPPPGLLEICDWVRPGRSELDVVGIPYPTWEAGNGMLLTAYDRTVDGWKPRGLEPGMNVVDGVGGGCVAISRRVLEALGSDPFRFDGTDTTEDFVFCDDVHAAGFKIGSWWHDQYADHVRVAGLSPIWQEKIRLQAS